MRIIVSRHTQTNDNLKKRYSGQKDIPLNDVGRAQAETLSRRLMQYNIVSAHCSDLVRALETTRIICKQHGLTPKPDQRLREVTLGKLDGMSKRRVQTKYPQAEFSTRNPKFDFRKFGGENADAVIERHRAALRDIMSGRDARPRACMLVVGHDTAMKLFVESLGIEWKVEQGEYQIIDLP